MSLARLGAMFGGLNGNRGGKAAFKRTLNINDFMSGNIACTAGEWQVLGENVVSAQNEISWGQGKETIPDTLGFVYIDLMDDTSTTAVQVEGLVRLVQKNANDAGDVIVFEERTEMLRGSTTDKKLKIALPEQVQVPRVGQDSKLVLEIKVDTTQTVDLTPDSGSTTVLLPVTVYQ